ncbi:MAG: RNA 2',3'-cyclic phosphodiesterase [Bdellovibrionales bacterium]
MASASERLFLGIGFEESLGRDLQAQVKKVKINLEKAELGHIWVRPENYHVTLIFLGSVEPERKDQIIQILRDKTPEFSSFELALRGVDAFESERQARAIYCGVQNKKDLRHMVDELRESLSLAPDSSYTPHLTIARLRNPAHIRDAISPVKNRDFFKAAVTEIRLYKSTLGGPYPIYTVLERFPLRQAERGFSG